MSIVKIREILRLYDLETLSMGEIGKSAGCSKSTVSVVLKKCSEAEIDYERAKTMEEPELYALIYPEKSGPKPQKSEPDWKSIHEAITAKGSRKTLAYVYQEDYIVNNPDGYSYSRFAELYRSWKETTGKTLVMPIDREPGKEMFIDWVGDTLDCVMDLSTGELLTANFFVTTLGDSSYPYVEATPNMTQGFWSQAHINALEYYGGVPRIFVPDNTKTAVIHRKMYDTDLNHSYAQLAAHYGCAVLPARVKTPRDKGAVEAAVQYVEDWLLPWVSDRAKEHMYESFDELNADIRSRLVKLVEKPFTHRPGSRKSVFEEVDKGALRPLPKDRFEAFETKICTRVPENYHLQYDGFFYSVPWRYYNQRNFSMHIYATRIEIYSNTGERVAIHSRRFTGSRYITDISHMPKNHRAIYEFNHFTGSYYRSKAATIGESAYKFISTLLSQVPAEEQAYKSCMGILHMEDKYGKARLEEACRKALDLHAVSYKSVKQILENGMDKVSTPESQESNPALTGVHENLRTGEWA